MTDAPKPPKLHGLVVSGYEFTSGVAPILKLMDYDHRDPWGTPTSVELSGSDWSEFHLGDQVEIVVRKVTPTPTQGEPES